MPYECQNFKNGQILTAECLNKIEKALEHICNKEIVSGYVNDNGELIFAFCDGSTMNLGKVIYDGDAGVSPVVSVEEITGGHRITITDANGTNTFDVLDGEDGKDGNDGTNGKDGTNGADGVSPTVEVSKTDKVTTITITDAKGTHIATISDGEDGADATDTDAIPDYWQDALDSGVAAINTAIETAGRNKSAFLFYTDAHWGYGSGMSPTLLKYLGKHTAINKTIFGGDFGNTYDGTSETRTMEYWMDVMRSWKLAVRDIPNHHSVVGNHDDDVTALADSKALYGFLFAPEETNDIVRGGDYFYYIDDPNEQTRYVYLNTGLSEFNDEQCDFVIDALSTLKAGWHIVAVAHIWFVYDSTATPTVGSVPANTQKLLALFDAYNSRSSGAITISKSHAYDFSAGEGWVEFCIGGHTHVDYDFTTDTGIPIILCATDSKHLRGSGYTYTAGTTTESSVSGIIADYDNRKIYVVRVGRGEGREITVTKNIITYTNVLPSALAMDGSVYGEDYNGDGVADGYKKDTRWSSSQNVDQTQDGTYITGYIPFTPGDVFRLKNVTMLQSASTTMLHIYKTLDDTGEANINVSNLNGYYNPVWNDDGNLVQFSIPTSSEYKYVRFQCGGITDESIITINEPID